MLTGINIPKFGNKTAIDLLDNHMDTRKASCDQIFLPGLQRLRHDGMVSIGERGGRDRPSVVPCKAVFVHEDTHQFGDRKRGVRIVDMDRSHFGQKIQWPVAMLVIVDDILQRCGNEKILLL